MREYQWDLKSGEQSPKPKKVNDDLLDADRYMHELTILKPFRTRDSCDHDKVREARSRATWIELWSQSNTAMAISQDCVP